MELYQELALTLQLQDTPMREAMPVQKPHPIATWKFSTPGCRRTVAKWFVVGKPTVNAVEVVRKIIL